VAHELPRLLVEPDSAVDPVLIFETHRLIGVLGRFWGRLTVECDPNFDDQEVNDKDIKSGSMLLMEHILAVLKQGS